MTQKANQITLRKNPDGTTTRVIFKKRKRKIVVKPPAPANTKDSPKKQDKNPKQVSKGDLKSKVTAKPLNKNKTNNRRTTGNKERTTGNKTNINKGPVNKRKKIVVARKKPSVDTVKTHYSQPYNNQTTHRDRKDIFQNENFNKFKDKVKEKNDVFDEYANMPSEIEIEEAITIKNLAHKLNLKASQLIKKFFSLGVMDVTVNDSIDHETASIVCSELKCKVKVVSLLEQTKVEVDAGDESDYIRRSPIVTVMGHVDHGKTSLLDAIRKTDIAAKESGGITQHIGAYKVKIDKGEVLFIDTPGHAAFSTMRARGAKVTDMIVLVVSAADGVMPQTIEAISHAKAEQVPIVVAINKCDLESAQPDNVKSQLSEHGVVSEEWGGDVIFHEISALKNQGIKELLESLILQSEISEIKGNPKIKAHGYVIESKIEIGRGNVITVVIKNGTLKIGDAYLCSNAAGKVRAMFDYRGQQVKEAPPSASVEIIGIPELPQAGELFQVVRDEKEGKRIADRRIELRKERAANKIKKVNIETLFDTIAAREVDELKVLIKGDVFGSVEAIKEALNKQRNEEVKVTVIHADTGAITENDVNLASASQAMIAGFKVKPNSKAKKIADHEGVIIKQYNVIYEILDDIQDSLQNMLKTEKIEEKKGTLTVKEIFKISGSGKIAGCIVEEGKVIANGIIRLYRDGKSIHEGSIATLKHYKDNVKEVLQGSECGLQIKDYHDIMPGDVIECYLVKEVKRELKISE